MLRAILHRPLKIFLFPLALFYRAMIFWRNWFYNIGFFVSQKLSCKIISIGNISVGGTGKTPAVIFLARLLESRGKRTAVLTRGYGRKSKGTVLVSDGKGNFASVSDAGDEPVFMANKINQIPIVADENRVRGGTYLIENFNPDIIILDDGFQHRAIERDLDIVLINSQSKNSDSNLLPYGLLREPKSQLKRADIIFLTKTNLGETVSPLTHNTDLEMFKSIMVPEKTISDTAGNDNPLESLSGKNVFALSGIGDPGSFHSVIANTGAKIVGEEIKPDHYQYLEDDLIIIQQQASALSAECIVTTEKDLVKIKKFEVGEIPIFAVGIAFQPQGTGLKKLLQILEL